MPWCWIPTMTRPYYGVLPEKVERARELAAEVHERIFERAVKRPKEFGVIFHTEIQKSHEAWINAIDEDTRRVAFDLACSTLELRDRIQAARQRRWRFWS